MARSPARPGCARSKYLSFCDRKARKRYEAGLSVRDAEPIAVNVDTPYREYRGDDVGTGAVQLFALMAERRR